jgi:hypothetical protein
LAVVDRDGESAFATLNIKKCTVKAKTSINFDGKTGGIIGVEIASLNDGAKAHLNIDECFVEATEFISINNDYNGIIAGFGDVTENGETEIKISNCIATCRKGSISSTSENSGSIIGYFTLDDGATIDIKNCLIQFCKEFSFEGLPTITSSLNVNDANKEYVIRGEITNGGTINVTNNEISTLCNIDVGIIPGISPQLLQTTQGGSARSNSRLLLRRTGFNQQMKNQFKDWNQNPKVPKVSQGERLRWFKTIGQK